MIERLVLLLLIAAAVVAISLVVRRIARRRIQAVSGEGLPPGVQARFPAGEPGILYFHGPHCLPCTQQEAILDRLSRDRGVPVVSIDAAHESALADSFGVMTVPATLIVDGAGRVETVNLGLRSAGVLLDQLRGLSTVASR